MIVIGLGTGRCGTHSLSLLLSTQKGFEITHELGKFNWSNDEAMVSQFFQAMKAYAEESDGRVKTVGDVASWYLNYVEYIINQKWDVVFICLKRDIDETVHSFSKKVPNYNHWTDKDSKYWKKYPKSPWDARYPKYDAEKRQALIEYVKNYHKRSEQWQERRPDIFRIFDINDLNTEDGQRSILSHARIPEDKMVVFPGIHTNKRNDMKHIYKAILKSNILRIQIDEGVYLLEQAGDYASICEVMHRHNETEVE